MFTKLVKSIEDQIQSEKKDYRNILWDTYLDRSLQHLVIEQKFNFEEISRLLQVQVQSKGRAKISQQEVRERWMYLHTQRQKDSAKTLEELRMDRVSISVQKMEDPKLSMTVEDLIDQLPEKRQQNDFLNISEQDILNSHYKGPDGQKFVPSTFNILRDSVRGTKDKRQYETQRKKTEADFFAQLDKISQENDEEMFEKPLIFKPQFKDQGTFFIEREEMNKENVLKFLANKIDMKNGVVPPAADSLVMDNFISKFVNDENEIEVQIKKNDTETETEVETDQENLANKQKVQTEDVFQKSFQLVDQGILGIDEAVKNFEQMRQATIKQNNFMSSGQQQQENPSLLHPKSSQEQQELKIGDILPLKEQVQILKQTQEQQQGHNLIVEDLEIDSNPQLPKQSETKNEIAPQNPSEQPPESIFQDIKTLEIDQFNEPSDKEDDEEENFFLQQRQQLKGYNAAKDQDNPKKNDTIINKQPIQQQKVNDDPKQPENDKLKDQEQLQKFKEEQERIQLALQEAHKKKEEELRRDQERLKQLDEEFKQLALERELKKKEEKKLKKQKEKEEFEELQRQREIAKKIVEDHQKKQQKEQEEFEQYKIDEKIYEIEKKIKSFRADECLYEKEISYMEQVSGLPHKIQKKFEDFSGYDISREGITSRYQILVFPFIDDLEFQSQFLGFFLRNSFLKYSPTEQELGGNYQIQGQKVAIDIPIYPRLSNHGFPFCLVSYFIGSFSKVFKDESDYYTSSYIDQQDKFSSELTEGRLKRHLFLFFDTFISKGSEILQKRLDLSLGEFIDHRLLHKISKKYEQFICRPETRLAQFMKEHIKSMELTNRIFVRTSALHTIPGNLQEDRLCSPVQHPDEVAVLIIRQYSEIEVHYEEEISKNATDTVTNITNTFGGQFSNLESQSQISRVSRKTTCSVVSRILEELARKGLGVTASKTFYFTESTLREYNAHIHYLKLEQGMQNKPVVVMVVQGQNVGWKLKKIIGSEDVNHAKKNQKNSINATFYQKSTETILMSEDRQSSLKQITYFFGAKLEKIKTLEQIEQITQVREFSFIRPKQSYPIFEVNRYHQEVALIAISWRIPQQMYGELFSILQRRGYRVLALRIISDRDLHECYGKNEANFAQKLEQIRLNDFQFKNPEQKSHSNNMLLKLSGCHFRSLRRKILRKILNYNDIFHPKKSTIFYLQQDPKILQKADELFFNPARTLEEVSCGGQFTSYENFQHFVGLWPFQEYHKFQSSLELQTFQSHKFEIVALKIVKLNPNYKENARESLQKLFVNQMTQNKLLKKKPEYTRFCKNLSTKMVLEPFIVAVFRLQEEVNPSKKQKLIESLQKEPLFLKSNYNLNENLIISHGQEKRASTDDPLQILLEFLFFDVEPETVSSLSQNLEVQLYDDTSMEKSFIYDLPYSGYTQKLPSLLVLNHKLTRYIPIQSLVRELESQQFEIQKLIYLQTPYDLANIITRNLTLNLGTLDLTQNDKDGKQQQLISKISQFNETLQSEVQIFIQLQKQNGIFACKQMANELNAKIAHYMDKEIKIGAVQNLESQISNGIYCSLNLQYSQQELGEFGEIQESFFRTFDAKNQGETTTKQQNEHRLILMMDVTEYVQKFQTGDLIRKITDLKFRFHNLTIFDQLSEKQIEYLSELFTPKIQQKNLLTYLQKKFTTGKSTFAFIDVYYKNVSSLLNVLGSSKIDDTGVYSTMINGQLANKNSTTSLLIYQEIPEKTFSTIEVLDED